MSKAIQKIIEFMEKKGVKNQTDLCPYVGYKSQGCISSMLSGNLVPSDKKKQFIYEKLGIKKQWWYM